MPEPTCNKLSRVYMKTCGVVMDLDREVGQDRPALTGGFLVRYVP